MRLLFLFALCNRQQWLGQGQEAHKRNPGISKIALLSPFLVYSGANEVERASVSVFTPTADFEQTTHFDQLFTDLSV